MPTETHDELSQNITSSKLPHRLLPVLRTGSSDSALDVILELVNVSLSGEVA